MAHSRNPADPVPQCVVSKSGLCYAWKCDQSGIVVYATSSIQAVKEWRAAYFDEYFPQQPGEQLALGLAAA